MYTEEISDIIKISEMEIEKRVMFNQQDFDAILRKFPKNINEIYSKNDIRIFIKEHKIPISERFKELLTTKPTRTLSGVAPITIFTKPYKCSGNCILCPTYSDSPKSYLPHEPGIQRAITLNYDPYEQVKSRLHVFKEIGHNVDKVEVIISGGTWDDYPIAYRYWFIKNIFLALNCSIQEEYKNNEVSNLNFEELNKIFTINSKTENRCIGLTIETRPDKIDIETIKTYRKFGVTKVQLGIQSLNDTILKKNCRGHTKNISINAVDLLRNEGFKIHIHWMCNLFGSTPQLDYSDFKQLFLTRSIQPDELKIYPCSVVEQTVLFEYYKKGIFKPYTTEQPIQLLIKCKTVVPEYCRITRLFRDIPSFYIQDGNKLTNLREIIQSEMMKTDLKCKCIRCNEIKNGIIKDYILKEFKYYTNTGIDYFISINRVEDLKIAGFLRLSIFNRASLLTGCKAMIREVHVYGKAEKINNIKGINVQHRGYGTLLLKHAEKIAISHKVKKIAVISAVGTREYYSKKGFKIVSEYGYGIKSL